MHACVYLEQPSDEEILDHIEVPAAGGLLQSRDPAVSRSERERVCGLQEPGVHVVRAV